MKTGNCYNQRIAGMLWKEKRDLIPALICILGSAGLIMLAPQWVRILVNRVLPGRNFNELIRHMGIGFLLMGLIQGLSFLRDFLRLRLTHRICAGLRCRLFDKVLGMPVRHIPEQRTGDLICRISDDVRVFQEGFLWGVFVFIPSTAILLALLGMMFFYSWILTLITLILFMPLIWVFHYFVIRIRRRSRSAQEEMAYLNNMAEETLHGMKEIKIFRQEKNVKERFGDLNKKALKAQIDQERMRILLVAVVPASALTCVGVLIVFCVWMMSRGMLALENLVAFLTCIGLGLSPALRLTRAVGFIGRIYGAMDRFDEILNRPSECPGDSKLPDLPRIKGHIQFENVNFHYEESGYAMKDLNLEIFAGEVIAIVGPSGAGKTTLLNLLQRFLEPDSGFILIDGRNITDFRLDSLRRQIGFVPQEPVLFDGTLMENLTFARPSASKDTVMQAARSAHVHEFAENLIMKYNTPIGQHGYRLSTGQKQRVAIARMFLTDPCILILDEPTSALDSESEKLIQDSLKRLFRERTTLIVAHRMNTIREADRIVVLYNGQITECGTPEELLKSRGLYYWLYTYQKGM